MRCLLDRLVNALEMRRIIGDNLRASRSFLWSGKAACCLELAGHELARLVELEINIGSYCIYPGCFVKHVAGSASVSLAHGCGQNARAPTVGVEGLNTFRIETYLIKQFQCGSLRRSVKFVLQYGFAQAILV